MHYQKRRAVLFTLFFSAKQSPDLGVRAKAIDDLIRPPRPRPAIAYRKPDSQRQNKGKEQNLTSFFPDRVPVWRTQVEDATEESPSAPKSAG